MKSKKTSIKLRKKCTQKTSLFKRITKSVVFLIVGLFLLTGVVLGTIVYKSTQNIMLNQLLEVSNAYTLVVQKDLNILQEKLNSIAQYAVSLPDNLDSIQSNNILDQKKAEYHFTTIYGISKDGKTNILGVTVNDRDYFKASISGEFYASSPFLKSDNTVGITVSVPAYRDKTIDGIISCGLEYDYFSNFVNFKIGKTGEAYIIDKSGTIVAHTDKDLVMNFYNSITEAQNNTNIKQQSEVISKFVNGDYSMSEYKTSAGIGKKAIASPISGTDGWILVTTMNNSELNTTSVSVIFVLCVIVIIGIIIGILAAMKLASGISKPISKINQRLTLLSEGDLSSDVTAVNTGDEIQSLSEGLGETITQLRMYISEISNVTRSMADYNLDTNISGEFKGEFMPIKDSLNQILSLMNRSFGEINEAANQVNSGADQVSSSAQALSQGAVEQASSIEILSETLSQVSDQVQHNAENATSANTKSNIMASKIKDSDIQMQQLIQAMVNISASSNEIGKIIKTIEDIAFQTNILALNAAVEAARAGIAGKGFAVVADEVRNLASKSAEAAKNTTALIEGSITAVKNGTAIADSTAKYLQEVVIGAKDVSFTIDQISLATNEQATSITQITEGIDQISAVIQTNSATAEESAAASEELSGQAMMLKALTNKFKLSNESNTEYTSSYTAPEPYDNHTSNYTSNYTNKY